MNLLNRIRSEPISAPAGAQPASIPLYTPVTPRTAARTRDPNATDYKYQVNQKCIFERQLPGGSYITAHLQRLQSGYYDSAIIHEDLIENVRFVAINFVFHPSRKNFRFKSADISVAIHHTKEDHLTHLDKVRNSLVPEQHSEHDHGTQTDTVPNALIRSRDAFAPPRTHPRATACRHKFLRHAPHLLYGSISPETLSWNFNVAGSLGVSQGPANASFQPSYGVKGSYKVYDMMRIQGSMRTLRSWLGHQYDVEDGEIVWTLEENALQKSGLPREFTFVMMLTKGSGGFEASDDVTLDIDIHPKVSGPLGGTYPRFVTGLRSFQPFRKEQVNLDQEIGQVFEPSIPGRGFNFANLASNFNDFVWLPGTTYSTSDNPNGPQSSGPNTKPQGGQQQAQQPQQLQSPAQHPQGQVTVKPSGDTTLNLRVFLENSRGSPLPISNSNVNHNSLPYVHLKPPSRNHSPLPPSVGGSQKSKGRSITITSQAPTTTRPPGHGYSQSLSLSQSGLPSGASAATATSTQGQARQVSHTHSLRKSRSRSGLDKEYHSSESPTETKTHSQTFHDALTGISPESQSLAHDQTDVVQRGSQLRYGDEQGAEPSRQTGNEQQDSQDARHASETTETEARYSTPPPREQRFPSLAVPQRQQSQPQTQDESSPSQHPQSHQETPPEPQQPELDPSTPSWHQHTSSPPSDTQHNPVRSTGVWNDTPPEWASEPASRSVSGSNTPTRNRSIRTRKATRKALEYASSPMPLRSGSLRIQASSHARDLPEKSKSVRYSYPATRDENHEYSNKKGAGTRFRSLMGADELSDRDSGSVRQLDLAGYATNLI